MHAEDHHTPLVLYDFQGYEVQARSASGITFVAPAPGHSRQSQHSQLRAQTRLVRMNLFVLTITVLLAACTGWYWESSHQPIDSGGGSSSGSSGSRSSSASDGSCSSSASGGSCSSSASGGSRSASGQVARCLYVQGEDIRSQVHIHGITRSAEVYRTLDELRDALHCLSGEEGLAYTDLPQWLLLPGDAELIGFCHHHIRTRHAPAVAHRICTIARYSSRASASGRTGAAYSVEYLVNMTGGADEILQTEAYREVTLTRQESLIMGTRFTHRHLHYPVYVTSPGAVLSGRSGHTLRTLEGGYAQFVQLALEEFVYLAPPPSAAEGVKGVKGVEVAEGQREEIG